MGLAGDYRVEGVVKRLSQVQHIVPVVSGKGGVGKTLLATTMALQAARKGLEVGLLDLDFTNPGTHIVLGIDPASLTPREEKGVVPPRLHGVEYMSITFYTGDRPLPLRGESVRDAILELLSITNWSQLDILFIDMPPGLRDEILELLRITPKPPLPLVVVQSTMLGLASARRLLQLLVDEGVGEKALVENMVRGEPLAQGLAEEYSAYYLGHVSYDASVDAAIGRPEKLLETVFAREVESVLGQLLAFLSSRQ